jgi:hypothetical protein
MKKLMFFGAIILLNTGCKMLRYNYEPALNEIQKTGNVVVITNDYIEYEHYVTNTLSINYIVTNIYRAHYTTSGKIFKTTQIK